MIGNVSSLIKCKEKLEAEYGSVVGHGKCSPCFAFWSATYLEVLEACVSLPEPKVKIPNKSYNPSNYADAKEYPCPSCGVERSLEARERVSELWVLSGHLPAPKHVQCSLRYAAVLHCSCAQVSWYRYT